MARKNLFIPPATDYDVLGMEQLRATPLRDTPIKPQPALAQAHMHMHTTKSPGIPHGKRVEAPIPSATLKRKGNES